MKELKFAIAGAGLLGVIGTFLPMVEGMGISISLWDVFSVDAVQFALTFAGYAAGLIVGGMAIAKPPLKRQFTGVALALFALSTFKMRDPGFSGAIGSKLLFVAGIIGILACIAALVKPEEE